MSPLLIGLIALVIATGGGLIFVLTRGGGGDARNRRMAIISGRGAGQITSSSDSSLKDKRRADLAKKLKESETGEKKKAGAKKASIKDMLIYAGIGHVPQSRFWIASAVSAAFFWLVSALMGMIIVGQIFFIVIGFFGMPRLVLKIMASRRQKKFLEEFADALESMVRLLKAGMPVGEAIAMVSREFSGPVGEEMSRVYDSQRIGVPMGEAVLMAAARMPVTEMQMFATGIIIQQQTGASLSEVLMNLAGLIRARFRLKRKVQALSAEAKASAAIIGALPVLVSLGLYFVNPDYIGLLFTTPKGKIMVSVAVGWMLVGMIIMRQMINFKV